MGDSQTLEKQDHHFIAQFYLRGWAVSDGPDKGKLLRHARIAHTGKVVSKWVAARGTAYGTNLYSAPSGIAWENSDPQSIEKDFMSPIDNDAAKVFPKILNPEPTKPTDQDERRAWARYLNSLLHRHKELVDEKDAWAAATAKPLRDRWIANAKDEESRKALEESFADADVEVMARRLARGEMVKAIDKAHVLDAIMKSVWRVAKITEGALLTTDRPLIVHMKNELLTMTMALSPTRLFILHPNGLDDSTALPILDKMIAEHNGILLAQGSTCVYTSAPIYEQRLLSLVERSLKLGAEKPLSDRRTGAEE